MKTDIIRLGSLVKEGVGGPETGAIRLIYSYLLQEMQLDFYDLIIINQIGEDLDELIISTGSKKVNINIRYATNELFDNKSIREKNIIRLDIIHTALMRLAVEDKRMGISKLEAIKNRILESNFSFERS